MWYVERNYVAEFFQHYFSEMGHRDLLVTQNLSQAIEQPTLDYLTRSVRRRAATSKCVYETYSIVPFANPRSAQWRATELRVGEARVQLCRAAPFASLA